MTNHVEIDHVQIAILAGGENQGRAFYCALLGMKEIAKPANLIGRGGCWFEASDRQIHLGVDTAFIAAKKAHIAFNTSELGELRSRLEKAEYKTSDDSDVDGRHRFFTHDPFGNRIEFMDRDAPK